MRILTPAALAAVMAALFLAAAPFVVPASAQTAPSYTFVRDVDGSLDSLGVYARLSAGEAAIKRLAAARRPAASSSDGVGIEFSRLVAWRAALQAVGGVDSARAAVHPIWLAFLATKKDVKVRTSADREAALAIFAAANRPNVAAGLDTAAVLALVRAELAPIRAELAETRAVADAAATKADLRRLAVLTASALGAVKPLNNQGQRTLAQCMNDMRATF